jgi:PEP-CTERM motif
MKTRAAAPRHRQTHIVLTACLAVALMAGQAVGGGIIGAPIDLSAFVHEGLLPGGTIFEDTHSVTGAFTTPKQSAEYLYLASKGENLSGHSFGIQGAFASALAESDGNGGVGVTSWIGGSPSNSNPGSIGQLVSQATWMQNFTYNGTVPASISLHVHIPALEVGLIGVPPFKDSMSASETAEAKATLEATIIHPDSSTSHGASFEFGMRAFETQIPLSTGGFANVLDHEFLSVNNHIAPLFDTFDDGFFLDPVSTDISLGTLQPGDTVSYVYQLTAQGTTHGFEQGYLAFLGDPFGSDVITDNLELHTSSVPEPTSWMLSAIGLVSLVVLLAVRRRAPMNRRDNLV